MKSQNELTRRVLDDPRRQVGSRSRLRELWLLETRSAPIERTSALFELRNDGTREGDQLWVTRDRQMRVLLDPSDLTELPAAISMFLPSPSGDLVACAISYSGQGRSRLFVVDANSGALLPDEFGWTTNAHVTWLPDSTGFLHTACDISEGELAATDTIPRQTVRLHRIGSCSAADEELFAAPDGVEVDGYVSRDGRHLIVETSDSHLPNRILVRETQGGGKFEDLCGGDELHHYLGSNGDLFYVHTMRDAPNGRVVEIDRSQPDAVRWREVVPESVDPIATTFGGAWLFGGKIVSLHTHVSSSVVRVTSIEDRDHYDVPLPGPGVITVGVRGDATSPHVYLPFTSYIRPTTIVRHNLTTRATELYFQPTVDFDTGQFVSELLEARSADGTAVPLTIYRRKDVEPDGARPVLLTGYGGFGVIAGKAGFQPLFAAWMERGGIVALANLRGGSEFGQAWHDAGRLSQKQNVFNDAIACAEHLVSTGWTNPRRLAFTGKSNGGLLAGALVTQRPDLFAAVVVEVGLLDMLRYHLFTEGPTWIPEYGSAADAQQFEWLRSYSPLHNVRPGERYPHVLVLTGDHDDCVPPGPHSYKFVATLQAATPPCNLALLRVDTNAGHGTGKPISAKIAEAADVLTFLAQTLDLAW